MTTRVIGGGRVGVRQLLRAPDVDVALARLAFIGLLVNRVVSHGSGVGPVTPLEVGLCLLTSLPLVLRRRFPLGVLAVVVPLLFVCLAVFHPNVAAVGVLMLMAFNDPPPPNRVPP